MLRLLELYSGTGSMGKAFKKLGWKVVSVDLRADFNPDICCDALDFDVGMLEGKPVDVVWASPPCTQYSCARTRAKTPRDLIGSDKLVQKVLDIAADLNSAYFIENPHSGLLKTRAVIAGCPMLTLDYCKYNALYRKRTSIWTNSGWSAARALCKYDCNVSSGRRHNSRAQRASDGERRFTLEELYSIPEPLCNEIAEAMNTRFLRLL
jgi:hypothetical protein